MSNDALGKAPSYIRAYDQMWRFINENPQVNVDDYVVQVDVNGKMVLDGYGAPHKYQVKSITPSGLILASKIFPSGKRGALTAVNARFKISLDPGQIDKVLLGDNVDYDPESDIQEIAALKRRVSEHNRKNSKRFETHAQAVTWMKSLSVGQRVWIASGSLLSLADYEYEVLSIEDKMAEGGVWPHRSQQMMTTINVKGHGPAAYASSYRSDSIQHKRVSILPPMKVEKR